MKLFLSTIFIASILSCSSVQTIMPGEVWELKTSGEMRPNRVFYKIKEVDYKTISYTFLTAQEQTEITLTVTEPLNEFLEHSQRVNGETY